MVIGRLLRSCAALAIALTAIGPGRAAGPYALVSGRLEPSLVVVDLGLALASANDGTPGAIISRVRVTPDVDTDGDGRPDAAAAGLPSNVVVSPDNRRVFVVNHAGDATPSDVAISQHGHPGTVTVLDLEAVLDPANDGSTNAIRAVWPSGGFGPVGLALTTDARFALIGHSEGAGSEDGGREIALIDLETSHTAHLLRLPLGDGGRIAQSPGRACPDLAANPVLIPQALPAGEVGCFADINGIGVAGGYAFTANGGTDDVSVIDLGRALRGDPGAEVARVAVERGPWGLAVSPDGRLVAVTNRESAETGVAGNTLSLLGVRRATEGGAAETARIRVGTDDGGVPTRPFGLAFTPDGGRIVVAQSLTDNVSIVSVAAALAGRADAEIARIALVQPGGGPARPRGVAVTADGRHAVVSGGTPGGGTVWLLDLATGESVATVTGVGSEPYLLAITPGAD